MTLLLPVAYTRDIHADLVIFVSVHIDSRHCQLHNNRPDETISRLILKNSRHMYIEIDDSKLLMFIRKNRYSFHFFFEFSLYR